MNNELEQEVQNTSDSFPLCDDLDKQDYQEIEKGTGIYACT